LISIVPTHVGVYRDIYDHFNPFDNCPHACGGVPRNVQIATIELILSPRMWGCTGTLPSHL